MSKNTALTYFQKYLKVAPLSHALWRSVEAQELAQHKLKQPVLDIGCGFGEFGGVFFPSQVEVGLDIDEAEILVAAASGKYKKTVAADARKLPFKDNYFRTVISISTLEHIPNNSKVFKETYRVLKPGGKFIYTVPTQKFFEGLLVVKFLNLLGLKELSFLYYRLLNKAFKHVFIPTEKIWLSLAKKVGFKIEKVQGTISPVVLTIWEIMLIFAIPSQISKILTGKRSTMFWNLKVFLFKPLVKIIKSDHNFRANIVVVAIKPKR